MTILTCRPFAREESISPLSLKKRAYVPFLSLLLLTSGSAFAASEAELKERIQQLEAELKSVSAELESIQTENKDLAKTNSKLAEADEPIKIGNWTVGGAIRAMYTVGDYQANDSGAPGRAWEDDGNVGLDTLRVNLGYQNGPYSAKIEYRWYNGYNFLHTGWVGYSPDDNSQIQLGVNRVPFGPGAGHYAGASRDSARYSYDVVDESGNGYEERNQINVRGIYSFNSSDDSSTDLGFSLQAGELKSRGVQSDGNHYAASVHMVNQWGNLKLATQLTRYEFDVDVGQALGTDDLVQFGAYDFASTAAAKGWIPAISLSYYQPTNNISWLDYALPYLEYSSIVKDKSGFNDSEMIVAGVALARGGWYIYNEVGFSNGNEFVGGDAAFGDRLGANADDEWQTRFLINFGYYF